MMAGNLSKNTAQLRQLLTIRDVADLAEVSIMTVRRWIDHHGLRTHRLGRLVRISQTDLETFFAARRQPEHCQIDIAD